MTRMVSRVFTKTQSPSPEEVTLVGTTTFGGELLRAGWAEEGGDGAER